MDKHMWYMRRTQKTEFIYKKLYIYFYMLKLQSTSKYSPLDAVHLLRRFFHCSKQFLNSLILMPFSTSAIFYFISSTSAKHFPLRTFFTQGGKCPLGPDRVNREGGAQGHAIFGACIPPIMKWTNTLKESSKKIHWSQMQPLTPPPAGTLIQMGS